MNDHKTSTTLDSRCVDGRYLIFRIALTVPTLIGLIAFPPGSDALKSGFYSHSRECKEILAEAAHANRTIHLTGIDKMQIGPGPGASVATREQARKVLELDREKQFVTVWFDKPILAAQPAEQNTIVEEVTRYLQQIGYKRILILAANSFGVTVLSDMDNPIATTASQPVPQVDRLPPSMLRIKFAVLAEQWKQHCIKHGYSSSIQDYLNCPAYQGLVKLGKPSIPLIMPYIRNDSKEQDFRFWTFLLEDITGIRHSGNSIDFNEERSFWLDWWQKQLRKPASLMRRL